METELLVIFTDKDFKYSWAIDWDIDKLKLRASQEPKLITALWNQDRIRAFSGLTEKFGAKNWKKTSDFDKAHKKWFFEKTKENAKRRDEGKKPLSQKEYFKGMPKFISKLKVKDVRVIFVKKNCQTNLLKFEEATAKKFIRIINQYKNEDTISG